MLDQLFELSRKAAESSLQVQQAMFKFWTQDVISTSADGISADFAGTMRKRWVDLTLDALHKHRESLDSTYEVGIQAMEQGLARLRRQVVRGSAFASWKMSGAACSTPSRDSRRRSSANSRRGPRSRPRWLARPKARRGAIHLMLPAKARGLDHPFRSSWGALAGVVAVRAIMGSANLESIAAVLASAPAHRPAGGAGADDGALHESPAFLDLMQCNLKVMSTPPYFGFPSGPRTAPTKEQRAMIDTTPQSSEETLPSFSLLGKKVFVTGGSRGIGRACALVLASAGADVALGSSAAGADSGEDVCREIRRLGRRAETYTFDVGVRRDVETTCARVANDFEGIDILVNNAGITRDRSFRKMDRGTWDEVINTNLNSVFDVTRAFIDAMAARRWGRVVNVSSIIGRIGNFGQANYAAAKAGLIGLTKTLAREYASKGVTVNAVAPGFVKTRMMDGVPDAALKSVLDITPIGRLGDPMEIAASVLYLASPAAGFVTGHVLDVNGGMAM